MEPDGNLGFQFPKKIDELNCNCGQLESTGASPETGAPQMKLFLERVGQAGGSSSRVAGVIILFATIFVIGAALPDAISKTVKSGNAQPKQALTKAAGPIIPKYSADRPRISQLSGIHRSVEAQKEIGYESVVVLVET